MLCQDEWPEMADGSDYDGKHLLPLLHNGKSPFAEVWDVNLLIQEIEEKLNTQVIDIPFVCDGSNNYVSNHNHYITYHDE